jgi:hypothetical protein
VNIWAIQSLLSGVFNLIFGLYVLSKGVTRSLNRLFFLFAFSFAIWSLTEAGHRATLHPDIAYLWIRAGGVGWCFMLSFYLHFILVFARKERFLREAATYIFLYLPPILFLYLHLTTELIYKQEVVKMSWGYTSMPGDLVWTYVVYYFSEYLLAIYFLTQVIRGGGSLEKKQARPILVGSTTALVIGTGTNVVLPALEVPVPELGTLVSILWMLCNLYAVLRHKLFIIEPHAEEAINIERKYHLKIGDTYLVKEERLDKGYEIFIDQLLQGRFGLCLSKLQPQKVRQRYGLAHTPIIWVTFGEDEHTLSPKDVDGMESAILDFLREADRPVIFIDCFNEIRVANGFPKAIQWLELIRTTCRERDCILLISVNPQMFEEKELAMIEKGAEEKG